METTLLATKLLVPPARPGLISRPRLLERLRAVADISLTLVTGPAGFGKTTLLSQWIQEVPTATTWLSLDEAENDSARFWEYVIAALRTALPDVGQSSIALLLSSERIPTESVLILLINDLSAISEDFVLVLDDYHLIQSEEVNKEVSFLLDHMPPKMHLIIGTRVDPPLPLAKLRGRGSLLEIRVDDLRFSQDEAIDLVSGLGVQTLSVDSVNALNIKTEGWAVGLKMALLAMQGSADPTAFVSGFTGTQRFIMDYLIEEVLQKQKSSVRDFLLKTSLLERLSAPLCDAVAEIDNSQEMLPSLVNANLFIAPVDSKGEWYRYHQLFRDLLFHRLRLEQRDELLNSLHLRAMKWYEDAGLLEDAIHHALEARNWEKAMDIISIPKVNLPNRGSLSVLNWFKRIPEELLRTRVQLYLNYVWAALMSAGLHDTVNTCLKYLDTLAEHDPYLQLQTASIRSQLFSQVGNYAGAEEYARKTLSLLSMVNPDYQTSVNTRSLAVGLLADICLRQLRLAEAEPLLKERIEYSKHSDTVTVVSTQLGALVQLGWIAFVRGKPREAVEAYEEAIALADTNRYAAMGVSLPHLYLGDVYYEWNDLERAVFHHEKAVGLYQTSSLPTLPLDQICLHLARARSAMRDTDGAAESLARADRLLPKGGGDRNVRLRRNAAYRAAIAIAEGDTESTSRYMDVLVELGPPVPVDTPTSVVALFMPRIGRASPEQLHAGYEQWARQDMRTGMIGARMLQALNCSSRDDAAVFLGDALRIGKAAECVRTFVDFGISLARPLRDAIARGVEDEYARKLLDIIQAEDRQRKRTGRRSDGALLAGGLLSSRELEVLRLVAEGLSNQQIATKLVISPTTAKTHVRHIFDKLGATGRVQAVDRARELRLLQSHSPPV